MADVSAVFDDPDGADEPIMMDVDEIPAGGDQSPGGTVLPFADLPTDVFDRIAAGMSTFARFTPPFPSPSFPTPCAGQAFWCQRGCGHPPSPRWWPPCPPAAAAGGSLTVVYHARYVRRLHEGAIRCRHHIRQPSAKWRPSTLRTLRRRLTDGGYDGCIRRPSNLAALRGHLFAGASSIQVLPGRTVCAAHWRGAE
jgi:hypothetical protein